MAMAANTGIARQLGKTARKRDRTLDVVVMAFPIQTLRLRGLVVRPVRLRTRHPVANLSAYCA
jgi:hypothetical protein